MQFDVGITFDYFFKGCPRHCFVLLEVLSEGAQSLVRLQGKPLTVALNISKVASFFQAGYDFPRAALSFRTVYDRHYNIKTIYIPPEPTVETPLWWDIARAVSSGAQVITFTQRQIFEKAPSSSIRAIGLLSDLVQNVYAFYSAKQKTFPKEGIRKLQSRAFVAHGASSVALTLISLVSCSQGKEKSAPLITLFLTFVYVGSHFINHKHPNRMLSIKQQDD